MQPENKQYEQVSILLVEDDDVDATSVKRAMKKLRLLNPLIRAKNGLEGLDRLRGLKSPNNPEGIKVSRPYVILLDLNMPCMNGIEMLQVLREDKDLNDSIVFVLTTSDSNEDRIAAYQQNITGYINKNQVEDGFVNVLNMLDSYWHVVELPK